MTNKLEKPLAVVMWSGGYDSTLLVAKLLKEGRRVLALTFVNDAQSREQRIKEESARDELIPILQSLYPKGFEHYSMKVPHTDVPVEYYKYTDYDDSDTSETYQSPVLSRQRNCQPVLWLGSLAMYLPYIPNGSEIIFSYIATDRTLVNLAHIEAVISSMANILDKNFVVKFPLRHYLKSSVLHELYDINPKLFEACVSCEYPSFMYRKQCRICGCCTAVRDAIINLSTDTGVPNTGPDSVWPRYLRKWFGLELVEATLQKDEISNDAKDDSDEPLADCNCFNLSESVKEESE